MRQLQLHRFGYDLLFYSFVLVLARRRWWHTIWTRRTVLHNYAVRIAKCIFILLLLLLLFSKFFYMFFFVVRCRHCCCLRLLRLLFFMQPIFLFSFSSFPSWSSEQPRVVYCMHAWADDERNFIQKAKGGRFMVKRIHFHFFSFHFACSIHFFCFAHERQVKSALSHCSLPQSITHSRLAPHKHTHTLSVAHIVCFFVLAITLSAQMGAKTKRNRESQFNENDVAKRKMKEMP